MSQPPTQQECLNSTDLQPQHCKVVTYIHTHMEVDMEMRGTTNAEWYEVREGSLVEVQWAVRWVGDDLWWEGFVEQVSFKSGMEERGSYGDGGDR